MVKDVQNIQHYNYTEETIAQIRSAYNKAVALISNTAATEAQLLASAATLRNLMSTTGSNTIAQTMKVFTSTAATVSSEPVIASYTPPPGTTA